MTQFAVSVMLVPAGGLVAPELDVSVHTGGGGSGCQASVIGSAGLVPMALVAVTV